MYVEEKKTYKQLLKQKKKEFGKNTAESVANNVNNSATFWKALRKLGDEKKTAVSEKINIEEWYKHFRDFFSLGTDSSVNDNINYFNILLQTKKSTH